MNVPILSFNVRILHNRQPEGVLPITSDTVPEHWIVVCERSVIKLNRLHDFPTPLQAEIK